MLLITILISLVACYSTRALNIHGDGSSVEKEMQQEVASTQRDYIAPDKNTDNKISDDKPTNN